MGSNKACSFGQTMISSGLDLNRAGWSCPDLGPAWPKERVLSSLYILDICLVLILIFPVIIISCGPTVMCYVCIMF